MPDETATKVAEFLLRIKAVELSPEDPFTWSSGLISPIYCDNRKILSYPRIRTFIRQELSSRLQEEFGNPEAIAGVATGGIAPGVLVAQELGLPFVYVRSEPKEHGKQKAIEGVLEKGNEVVVIEDLISTGQSSLNAVERLREEGLRVKGLVAIFSYGFEKAREAFEEKGCPFSVLSQHDVLIREARKQGFISEKELNALEEWRKAPEEWGKEQESR